MNQKNLFRILIAICFLGNTLTTNAQQMKDGFVKIFDGKSMAGWDADTTFWKVKDNSFVGEVTPQTPIKTNTFLIYRESLPADFELKQSIASARKAIVGLIIEARSFLQLNTH